MKLRTCVLPCAGYGTRFLPATKEIPKEMLPLIDKPIVQYGVEEALASGLDRIVVVTSRGKESIIDHFDRNSDLEQSLARRGKDDLQEEVVQTGTLAEVTAVRQKEVRGLGHAVLCAEPAVGREPFAVLLPDDVIFGEPPALAQMRRIYEETGRPVVALMEVGEQETSRYGIIAGEEIGERTWRISAMVEKPEKDPPSRLAIIGRYILPPEIFAELGRTGPGAGGEIQLTDALRALIETGEVYGCLFRGIRYDAGEKLGYLQATVDYALRHPEFGGPFRAYLESVLERDR